MQSETGHSDAIETARSVKVSVRSKRGKKSKLLSDKTKIGMTRWSSLKHEAMKDDFIE